MNSYPIDGLFTFFSKITEFCSALDGQNIGVYKLYLQAIRSSIDKATSDLKKEPDANSCKLIINIACNQLYVQISNLGEQMTLYNNDKQLAAEQKKILENITTFQRLLFTCDDFSLTSLNRSLQF